MSAPPENAFGCALGPSRRGDPSASTVRESSDGYRRVILRRSEWWRVIVCRNGIQWIVQRRVNGGRRGGEWKAVHYCPDPRCADPPLRCLLWPLRPLTIGGPGGAADADFAGLIMIRSSHHREVATRGEDPSALGLALAYIAHGYPVFPCNPLNKRPLTAHGFKDASTDPDAVRAMWRGGGAAALQHPAVHEKARSARPIAGTEAPPGMAGDPAMDHRGRTRLAGHWPQASSCGAGGDRGLFRCAGHLWPVAGLGLHGRDRQRASMGNGWRALPVVEIICRGAWREPGQPEGLRRSNGGAWFREGAPHVAQQTASVMGRDQSRQEVRCP